MKRSVCLVLWLVLAFGPTWAEANKGQLDIPANSNLIWKMDGTLRVQAKDGCSGLAYAITAKDRKGRSAQGLRLESKTTEGGLLLLVTKSAGSPGFVGNPDVTITLAPNHSLKLVNVHGTYLIEGLAGDITGKVKAGRVVTKGCSGGVALRLDEGNFTATDYRPAQRPFMLTQTKGEVFVELSGDARPGPGALNLRAGRVEFAMKQPAPLQFIGEVKQGLLTCNLPLSSKNPNFVRFSSLGGTVEWFFRVEKGVLSVRIPDPRTAPGIAP